MDDADRLAARFEESRSHLRLVGYRMPGSLPEAEDAVQDLRRRLKPAVKKISPKIPACRMVFSMSCTIMLD